MNNFYISNIEGPIIHRVGNFIGKPVFKIELFDPNSSLIYKNDFDGRFIDSSFNIYNMLQELVKKASYDRFKNLYLVITGYEPLTQLDILSELLAYLFTDLNHEWHIEIFTKGNINPLNNISFVNFIKSTNPLVIYDLNFTIELNFIKELKNIDILLNIDAINFFERKGCNFIFNINYDNIKFTEDYILCILNNYGIPSNLICLIVFINNTSLSFAQKVSKIAIKHNFNVVIL